VVLHQGQQLLLGADVGIQRAGGEEVEPGDWDSSEMTATPEQTGQYVTLYESLRCFDESAVELTIPRLAFAGADDLIVYGAEWDHARVDIGPALVRNKDELERRGWTVHVIEKADHMTAMHAEVVRDWLRGRRRTATTPQRPTE
jgi:hypothetical protein